MRVLFVSPGLMGAERGTGKLASFQQVDLELLQELGYEVRPLLWYGRPLGQLFRGARWADVVFCWSISDHALASSLVARRLACVVGGYEFANLPECHYGSMLTTRMRWLTKWVWKRADALLYVDPSLEEEATRAFGSPGRAFYVPTGYDSTFWTPGDAPRQNIAVTVCHAPTPERIRLKGVDLFLEAARANPEFEFHVVGELPPGMRGQDLGPNVVADGWLERDDLRDLYRRAKVYCQFSLHEGLPNAVCEAMLCGCVPVGTRSYGIPTAMDDAGFLVERDVGAISEGIRAAMEREDLRGRARDHIVRTFPVERRRRELKEILERLVSAL
ncbi:MAG TPA: glycosyltransferase family 4 protein [Thermoplasmata archaeon]|nr:glycosyltransferase family 4 protein [Thermoplasmata archaeon]